MESDNTLIDPECCTQRRQKAQIPTLHSLDSTVQNGQGGPRLFSTSMPSIHMFLSKGVLYSEKKSCSEPRVSNTSPSESISGGWQSKVQTKVNASSLLAKRS